MKQAIISLLGLICLLGATAWAVAGTQMAHTDQIIGLECYAVALVSGLTGAAGVIMGVRGS